MGRLLLIAAGNLLRHRRRTALVGGAIALVTMVLVALLGLVNATRAHLYAITTTFMSGEVNVGGIYKLTPHFAQRVMVDADKVEAVLREKVPGLERVAARQFGRASVISQRASLPEFFLVGVDLDQEPGLTGLLHATQGQLSGLREPGAVVLFEEQAKKLEVTVGDRVTVSGRTLRGTYNAVDVTVAAIARNVGGFTREIVLLSSETVRDFYKYRPGSAGVLQLHLAQGAQVDLGALKVSLQEALTAAGYRVMKEDISEWPVKKLWAESRPWTGQYLDVTRWEDEVEAQKQMLDLMDVLVRVLSFILLMVAATGVMNTLWLAIRERTGEIGTLRAIGMQRGGVVVLFVLEALLLGLLGASIGAGLGVALGAALNLARIGAPLAVQTFLGVAEHYRFSFELDSILWTIVLITGCSAIASLLPSILAARLRPVTAIHRAE